jgi:hypothetical protein
VLLAAGLMCSSGALAAPPTPDEYVSEAGGDARIIPAGELTIDGQKVICGQRPTVLDSKLDDYGAAYPGFLIFNPKYMGALKSTAVKLWIHAHELSERSWE